MAKEMRIKVMKLAEMDAAQQAAFDSLPGKYLPGSSMEKMKERTLLFPEAFVAVMADDNVIGVAYGWPRSIDGIAVADAYQKNGYGKKLLQAFEGTAKRYGAPAMSVGSAGGCVEKFYMDCGCRPIECKAWIGGAIAAEKPLPIRMTIGSISEKMLMVLL